MKMKGLGARTLQFSFKQIFYIEQDAARVLGIERVEKLFDFFYTSE